ncbi:MAG: hypothetical protein RL088_1528 [Verrucomicrobiota bacterium]|jgi:hypothetical protein
MKPFIKPRPPASETPEPASPKPSVSLNELTVFAIASAMPDQSERAAYLDRTCNGDAAMRQRIEERLATRPAEHVPSLARPATPALQTGQLEQHGDGKNSPALALVPVSAMQFPALPPQLQRQVTFAWGSATLMALAVGALAVTFYFEKDARVRAEASAKEANTAAEQSLVDRERSEARALEARTEAQRTADARAKAEKERDAATAAARESERLRAEADKQRAELEKKRSSDSEAAKAEREKLLSIQRTAAIALADNLASLASFQITSKAYAEAEASARQCIELRTANGVEGWPIVEARTLLGEASLQRSADADAEREFTSAATLIESLGTPASDVDRARFTAASRLIVRYFTVTGRRREATDWKRRLDAIAPRPQ